VYQKEVKLYRLNITLQNEKKTRMCGVKGNRISYSNVELQVTEIYV
jgi:hypothetical protein